MTLYINKESDVYFQVTVFVFMASYTVQAQLCIENFKDIVTSDGAIRGQNTTVETRLIPSMRFTCSGTIVAFTVTGMNRNTGIQDPKIQVWRENKAQCGSYQKLASEITVHQSSCSNLTQLESVMPAQIFYCVLKQSSQVSFQYGDILGIELPPTNHADFNPYFTDGGPVNYVFQQQLSSTINSITESSVVEEQPQITLEIDSDFLCSSGYPAVTSEGTGRGTRSTIVTRLFPDLKFTCDGIITQYTVGGVTSNGTQEPKIQIWRESPNQCGAYFKLAKDIVADASVCKGNAQKTLSTRVFQCTLKERFRVQVQAGDILGLELPPSDDRDFLVHFTSGGSTNYVFESQLSSAVILSNRNHNEVQEQPQVNVTVEALSISDATTTSVFSTPLLDEYTTTAAVDVVPSAASSMTVVATVTPVLTIVLMTLAIIVILVIILQRKKGKKAITEEQGFDNANNYSQLPREHMHPQTINDEVAPTKQVNTVQTDTENDASTISQFTKSNEAYATSIVTENNVAYYSKIPEYTTIIDSREDFDRNNHQTHAEDDAYVVPAFDEPSLYDQFSKIKIQTLNKRNISTTKLLGSGQFGTVDKGEWVASEGGEKIEVAVKTLKEGAGEGDKVKFLQEAAIMGQFSHPNVVKLYGVVTEGEPIMLILELLPKGDLQHVLQSTESVDADLPHTLLSYCRQVASGMSYLSNKLFVHRDLAARNILVSEDGACKVGNFVVSVNILQKEYGLLTLGCHVTLLMQTTISLMEEKFQ